MGSTRVLFVGEDIRISPGKPGPLLKAAPVFGTPKSCAMAKATHTAMLVVRYFLAPVALYIGLVAIGTFTGSLFITNLMIFILFFVGFFAVLFLFSLGSFPRCC